MRQIIFKLYQGMLPINLQKCNESSMNSLSDDASDIKHLKFRLLPIISYLMNGDKCLL